MNATTTTRLHRFRAVEDNRRLIQATLDLLLHDDVRPHVRPGVNLRDRLPSPPDKIVGDVEQLEFHIRGSIADWSPWWTFRSTYGWTFDEVRELHDELARLAGLFRTHAFANRPTVDPGPFLELARKLQTMASTWLAMAAPARRVSA